MSDVTVAVSQAARASNGLNVTDNDTAASSGNNYYFQNDGRTVLVITNGAGSNTVTVQTPGTQDGLAITDLTATVAASKVHVLGPFPPTIYNDALGRVLVTVSASAELMPVRVG